MPSTTMQTGSLSTEARGVAWRGPLEEQPVAVDDVLMCHTDPHCKSENGYYGSVWDLKHVDLYTQCLISIPKSKLIEF